MKDSRKYGQWLYSRIALVCLASLLVLLGNTPARAQYYSRRSVLFDGTSNGFISSLQVVKDTIYAMCAVTDTIPPYRAIGTFNTYDNNGNIIFKHRFDIPGQVHIGDEHGGLVRARDGGFIYGGYCYSDSDNSLMLLKFDKEGNQLWYKTYSDSGRYLGIYVYSFTQDSSANYYFVGSVTQRLSYDNDNLVGKVDSSGNLIYFKVINDPSLNDQGLGVCINHSDHLVATADCGTATTASGVYHKFYELDSAGNILRYSLGTDTFGPSIIAVIEGANSNYFMAGGSLCEGGYIDGYFKGNISCFDSNFHQIWSLDLGPCGGYNTAFWALQLLPDSNYLAVGKWYDPADTTHYDQYGWLVKFTADGTVLWDRKYRGLYNPSPYGDESQLLTVGLFSDSTIIAAGEATDRSASRNSQQGWLLHLDADGCLPDSNSCGVISGVKEMPSSPEWTTRLYPDPVSDRFTLDYQIPTGADAAMHLIVTDALGREVYKESISDITGTISMQTSHWPSGIYYCIISGDTGARKAKPFSVMH